MLKQDAALELVTDHLLPAFQFEKANIDAIDCWYRHPHELVDLPHKSTEEHKKLRELAKTPFLGLVVTTVAQAMYADGYRTPNDADPKGDATPWNLWLSNGFPNRQTAIHRAALAYGHAYATALPGVDAFGNDTAVLRGVSPRKMLAFYADPGEDDWPLYGVRVEPVNADSSMIRLYDDEAVYRLGLEGGEVKWIDFDVHGLGFCPIVRYANMLDLDGRSDGEVFPFIPIAKRIDKTVYDRLLTQHFNSWKVRTVTGMTKPDTDEDVEKAKLVLRQNDLLIGESTDTKFGTLDETSLDGFIAAYESDIKTLAAATQTPVHAMVGDLINISAEGLAAARSSLDAKVSERKGSFGASHQQLLRAGAFITGDMAAAQDIKAHVIWRDTSIRSLASAADALGKFAQMLGVPVEALWAMIPGVTKTDIEEWRDMKAKEDPTAPLLAALANANNNPGALPAGPAPGA